MGVTQRAPNMIIQISYFVEGGDSPLRKEEKNASELLGLKQGTAWPAPRNVANVSPSYSSNHPLTCSNIIIERKKN